MAVGPASHGVAEVNFDGTVKYTPAVDYSGPDSFLYTVSDGLLTASALVTVTVRSGNVAPVANNDFYNVNEGTTRPSRPRTASSRTTRMPITIL